MQSKQKLRNTPRKFRTLWGELEYVCAQIHKMWYAKKHKSAALARYLSRLECILEKLPEDDMAILREEGLALLHELKGHKNAAIRHRKREIELTEKLHEDVKARGYDQRMKASILVHRDDRVLQQRRAILQGLQEECSQI